LIDGKGRVVPLRIAITCDTVSDYFDSSLWLGEGEAPVQWRGIEEGIDAMVESSVALRDVNGKTPRFTWFVPVDNHIQEKYGVATYLLSQFSHVWEARMAHGDEIAWHVYQHKPGAGQWFPEEDYDIWHRGLMDCREQLDRLGFCPRSTRVGGTHCSNRIMQILEELGIVCDMTALPGRVRSEGFLRLDWRSTPTVPYYPSIGDYRTPGQPARSILEIPLTMALVEAEYDREPFRRYVDFTFYHSALATGLKALLHANPSYLAVILHPSAVLSGIAQKRHGLLSFAIEEFTRNMSFVVEECDAIGRPIEFVTVEELAEITKTSGEVI
jgi:hypothetical protein